MSELAQKSGKLRKLLLRKRVTDDEIGEPTSAELQLESWHEQLVKVTAERDAAITKLNTIKELLE